MSYQELKGYEARIDEQCDYFVSTPDLLDHQPRPLFFYHLMKTGGMTLDLVIRNNVANLEQHLRAVFNQPSYRAPLCVRVDNDTKGLDKLNEIDFMFICGHVPYGTHRSAKGPIDTLAVFREPYSRTLSEYTYQCMRQDSKPTEEEFYRYITNPDTANNMTRAMCENAGNWSLEEAISNMDELTYVAITKDLREVIEYYLSSYGLPNVLTPRINATHPEYLLSGKPFQDEFYQANQADVALYQHALATRRLPQMVRQSEGISDLTTILYEPPLEGDRTLTVAGKIGNTEIVINTLQKQVFPNVTSVLDEIVKRTH